VHLRSMTSGKKPRLSTRFIGTLALTAALIGGALTAAPTAQAATNPYERGPAPTNASIEAEQGPFAITQTSVTGQTGFAGGTLYYPTDASKTYGAVAIVPAFLSLWEFMSWIGPRLASQGFVVVGIQTNGLADQPDARAAQLAAALTWVTTKSPAASRTDKTRLGVAGWSMGGGGTLQATLKNPALKAAVGLAPWNPDKNFSQDRVPTAIIAGQNDSIAPVADHARAFYNSIPATTEKEYLEIKGGDHFFPFGANALEQRTMISWFKRFIDNDTRYSQFICPGPPAGSALSVSLNTCPV
jgi:dienelactone hydrolase